MPCGETSALKKLRLEDLSEFEVHLPLGITKALLVHTIETVPQIDSERSQRRHDRAADADAAEQSRRIEVAWTRPEVAGVVERVEIEHLVEAKPQLDALGIECVSKGCPRRRIRA